MKHLQNYSNPVNGFLSDVKSVINHTWSISDFTSKLLSKEEMLALSLKSTCSYLI